jgi:hypothetical protein
MVTNLDVVGFEDRVVTYLVTGKTIEQIDKSMRERTIAPNGFYFYTLYHHSTFKNIRGILLVYQIVVIKPEWNRKGGGADVEGEWNRYMNAGNSHENGHVKMYSTAFRRLKELAQAERVTDILALAQRNTDRYDLETDHGRLEGARIGSTINPTDFSERVNLLVKEIEDAT